MIIVDSICTVIAKEGSDTYIRDLNVHVHIYGDSMYVTNLSNALKPGKLCTTYIVRMVNFYQNNGFINAFEDWLDDLTFEEFIRKLLDDHERFRDIDIQVRHLPAKSVFSPFVKVNLVRIPSKWTLPHIWKGILSGQITVVFRISRTTDDYAADDACNYGRGSIDPMEFARKIIKNPCGWWVGNDVQVKGNVIDIRVCCHHFDINTVSFTC